jgi:uncharacterized protein (DUF433 family)
MATVELTEVIPLSTDNDGVIRVGKTRVTLDTIVGAFKDGAAAEEIAYQYPTVSLADIYSVIGHYLRQKTEVDAYLKRREKFAAEIRRQNEARFDATGIRERLLARRNSGE